MKSEIEIVDDIYSHIKASGMMSTLSGNLHKDERMEPYSDEDVVISRLAIESLDNDIQEAYINVNIYVRDLNVNGQRARNRKRLKVLCKLAENALKVGGIGKDYTFHLVKQEVFRVEDNETSPEHKINNRLLYQVIDE